MDRQRIAAVRVVAPPARSGRAPERERPMSIGGLVATLLLLLANGFFVAIEFALIASRRTKLETLAEHGNRQAQVGARRRTGTWHSSWLVSSWA